MSDEVVVEGRVNTSQDGIVVNRGGVCPCIVAGHGNCPKVLELIEN